MTKANTQNTAQLNPNDVFELTRAELNAVVAYLGKRPAEEVYHLLGTILSKPVARAAAQETANEETATAAEASTSNGSGAYTTAN